MSWNSLKKVRQIMYSCPYTNTVLTDAGDGVLMCSECDCLGWSKESLKDINDNSR